ncbi:hypothetical protein GCM10011367_12690 [Marinicauda pacifica]|uniref:Uncharacterized protein n=1 Tax=Marinicauda pacifica TaxID=1133559 RepID=A0A4S2HGI1_9PROT|nr:hypothetical protein [Marinicauda pacifica]TGY94888.1 hypothetical protein E5162_06415 [Marinicauda pacifica]GGE39656.1 hypothetical protein GCM10011367_12690 [Marinicauda pacifica]
MHRIICACLTISTALGFSACEATQQDRIRVGGWEGTAEDWARLGGAYQRDNETRLESGWRVDCVESEEREDTIRCFAAISGTGSSDILHISFYNDQGPVIELRNGSRRVTEMAVDIDSGPDISGLADEDIVEQMRRGEVLTARYDRLSFSQHPVMQVNQYDVSAFNEAFERLDEIRNDPDYEVVRLPGAN